jgi:deoxyribodipyrimidine photo-lyase
MNSKRLNIIKKGNYENGTIAYWMQRDQRVNDNWALSFAYQEAVKKAQELVVIFNLVDNFLDATIRHYTFMIEGLREVEKSLAKLNIQFFLLTGKPEDNIPKFVKQNKVGLLITDFNPLKIARLWKQNVNSRISIPFYEIDAHNVVPIWVASNKTEFAAYTIRPKIRKLLPEYLDDFPKLEKIKNTREIRNTINWENVYKNLKVNMSVSPINHFIPGEGAANDQIKYFIQNKLNNYSEDRNDPNKNNLSNISPYLHFGQISAQRIALILNDFYENNDSVSSYLEELIVRRELADNYCFYNKDYDNFKGFHDWAQKTLNEHRNDKRDYYYKLNEFENFATHDKLWNAAQMEMVYTGKMHGFMRMYWAKKILEWTESPEQALYYGIYLNDKYELDGRDPNGYTGLAWSIGGVHDRAWTERPVFGKIRYMNYNGCKRKFDVINYIKKVMAYI